jgi:hypothetical protein
LNVKELEIQLQFSSDCDLNECKNKLMRVINQLKEENNESIAVTVKALSSFLKKRLHIQVRVRVRVRARKRTMSRLLSL